MLCMALSLSSCAFRPRGVLSNKEMEDVLVDLHSAEGILQVAGYNYGHFDACNIYYGIILDKHGVTQAQFDSSLVWYTAHPQYFQSVYPKVLKRLQKRHDDEMAQLALIDEELRLAMEDSLARLDVKRLSFEEMMTIRLEGPAYRFAYLDTCTPMPLCTDSFWLMLELEKMAIKDSLATEETLAEQKNAVFLEKN